MMLVQILNFGSNWWARFGSDPADRYRFTRRAAYFNSTGLRFGNKIRRHWIVPGLIRFNGIGDFNPQFPRRSLGAAFEMHRPDLCLRWKSGFVSEKSRPFRAIRLFSCRLLQRPIWHA